MAWLILSISGVLFGQDSVNQKSVYPEDITIEYGVGSYAVTDDYISTEKYSGSMPYIEFSGQNLTMIMFTTLVLITGIHQI